MTIIRDPLWNNILVDDLGRALVDTPAFQRLRYVRQLGWAFLVYPGATHTRFEHALGAYHLASRTLARLDAAGQLAHVAPDERPLVCAAALLHDIGHYPFSHALEEIGTQNHEEAARPLLTAGPVAEALSRVLGDDAPDRIHRLIRGESDSPLQRLISGSVDLDKIDYLKRDALMCGVPYGEVDVDRLIGSLVVVNDPVSGALTMGVLEKGLAALESLLFAKYQMYRNVYWHHAVRSATAMYKRLVDDALAEGALDAARLATYTDEGLLHDLDRAASNPLRALLARLRGRQLYKRALEVPAADVDESRLEWIATDRARAVHAENRIADGLGLAPGEVILDFPAKEQMLGLDLPLVRRDGTVERLTGRGIPGAIDLPQLSQQFYRSARWLRVFVAQRRTLDLDEVVGKLSEG